jgi:signal transduction histidine kinase
MSDRKHREYPPAPRIELNGAPPATLTGPVMLEREYWLIRLRWLAVAGMVVLTAVARWGLGLRLDAGWIFALAAWVAFYNLMFLIWLRSPRCRDGDGDGICSLRVMTNLQISMDLLVLTGVLHFSGGVTNPLAAFMVFHMAIASILLPRRDAYGQAIWASALYVGLAVTEAAFPSLHRPMGGYLAPAGGPAEAVFSRPLFVLGECAVLVVTLLLIVYFTSDIAVRLRAVYGQLAGANRELARLEQTKSQFLRIASHQIRTPLAALVSMMDAMGSAPDLSESQRAMIVRGRRRAGAMLELVNEMLTLSAVKTDLRTIREQRVIPLNDVLRALLDEYAEAARAGDVQLEGRLDGEAEVRTWAGALEDVLGNLISNAVKYTRPGGHVEVVSRPMGRRVVVTVADTGIGIPAAAQAQLFSEFFRAPNARAAAEGTGLGLSIVKETLDRVGGRITLCSAEGHGTTVQVELPTV